MSGRLRGPPRGIPHEGCGGTFVLSRATICNGIWGNLRCDRCGALADTIQMGLSVRDMPGPWADHDYVDGEHRIRKPRGSKSRRAITVAATLMAVAFLGAVWWFGLDGADVRDIALDGINDAAGGASDVLDGISDAAREASDVVEDLRPGISTADDHTADSPVSQPERVEKLTTELPPDTPTAEVPKSPLDRTIYPDGSTHGSASGPELTTPNPEPEPQQTRAELIEGNVHAIVNQHREAAGLLPLERDPMLDAIARAHAQDMADRNYYDHDTPEGLDPSDRANVAGYECIKDRYGGQYFNRHSYYMAGIAENIHKVYGEWYDNPTQMARFLMDGQGHQMGWMDSYGHRQNILHHNYDRIGVGVAFNDVGDVYATQNFC